MTRRRDTKDDLVQAALAYVDSHGVDSLTLRSLGAEVGLHHTALYRHFRSKADLLSAIQQMLLTQALEGAQPFPADPRERLVTVASAFRAIFRAHPGLAASIVSGTGQLPQTMQIQRLVLEAIREMGVAADVQIPVLQSLESYVAGTSLYDFAGAPLHLEQRRQRYRLAEDPALDAVSIAVADIDRVNESAFLWGLNALLDSAVGR